MRDAFERLQRRVLPFVRAGASERSENERECRRRTNGDFPEVNPDNGMRWGMSALSYRHYIKRPLHICHLHNLSYFLIVKGPYDYS